MELAIKITGTAGITLTFVGIVLAVIGLAFWYPLAEFAGYLVVPGCVIGLGSICLIGLAYAWEKD